VIDKPPGLVVHPAAGHADGTLVNALLFHLDGLSGIGGVERPGIVHRLDRGTSGLMVVAKNDAAHQHLAAQFAEHSAGRRYLALCMGVPTDASGTVRSFLGRHPTDRLRFASTTEDRGKIAITHWRRVAVAGTISLIECRLETGRTHQVRVHLTEQGWPLVGDPTYQRRSAKLPATLRFVDPERPLLHAWRLDLTHPRTGAAMAFERPPPADFVAALEAVGIRLEPGQLQATGSGTNVGL
jgi:23S rRNA pseudouridine1911/1915/1917 synthase